FQIYTQLDLRIRCNSDRRLFLFTIRTDPIIEAGRLYPECKRCVRSGKRKPSISALRTRAPANLRIAGMTHSELDALHGQSSFSVNTPTDEQSILRQHGNRYPWANVSIIYCDFRERA